VTQTYLLSAAPGLQRKASFLHPLYNLFTKPVRVRMWRVLFACVSVPPPPFAHSPLSRVVRSVQDGRALEEVTVEASGRLPVLADPSCIAVRRFIFINYIIIFPIFII